MKNLPRVAAVHDLSCFGRCSLTIVLPTLAAMGVQCCPLPTACLSTHTGGFTGNTFLDLTEQMEAIAAHWKSLELRFDGIYTGFMGSRRQMELTEDFLRAFRAMASLAELADVVTPNRTEAALLLGVPYEELRLETEADCRRWAEALSLEGRRSVVLTGVSVEPGAAGAVCFDRAAGRTELVLAPLAEGSYHGTGDLFAGVLTGGLVKGAALAEAAGRAAEFVSRCARRTREAGTPVREGARPGAAPGGRGGMTENARSAVKTDRAFFRSSADSSHSPWRRPLPGSSHGNASCCSSRRQGGWCCSAC